MGWTHLGSHQDGAESGAAVVMIAGTLALAAVWWLLELESISREAVALYNRDELSRMPLTRERVRAWRAAKQPIDWRH